ncbi:MAG: Holliday junction resolvase RuvX [Planctomycetota bacterium]
MGAVLAIDWGTKKSGFAVADPLRIVVQPLDAVRLDGDSVELLDHVERLGEERDLEVLLISLPVEADGSDSGQAKLARAFMAALAARLPDVTIVPYPERLTSKEAESRLREAGLRGKAAKDRRDSWSAWVLLEDWIRSGEPRG